MLRLSLAIVLLALFAFVVGCQTHTSPPNAASSGGTHHDSSDGHKQSTEAPDPKVSAALAKLSTEDRKIAESQQFCAVMNRQRLGSMGAPLKLEIKGQAVFVCCSGCKAKALKNPDQTLTKVAALKSSKNPAQP